MDRVYYEDLQPCQKYRSEPYLLTSEKIIEFAQEWDPDGIHVDPEFARTYRFGGLIAPASMLMAIWSKLIRQQEPSRAYIAGLGLDQVRFLLPGRPGDLLVYEEELLSKRKSNSDPTSGIVHLAMRLVNQRDDPVLTLEATALIEMRPAQ